MLVQLKQTSNGPYSTASNHIPTDGLGAAQMYRIAHRSQMAQWYMQCDERELLWQVYNESLTEFSRSADDLTASLRAPNFADKVRVCQEANDRCKAARVAWEQHLKKHGC